MSARRFVAPTKGRFDLLDDPQSRAFINQGLRQAQSDPSQDLARKRHSTAEAGDALRLYPLKVTIAERDRLNAAYAQSGFRYMNSFLRSVMLEQIRSRAEAAEVDAAQRNVRGAEGQGLVSIQFRISSEERAEIERAFMDSRYRYRNGYLRAHLNRALARLDNEAAETG